VGEGEVGERGERGMKDWLCSLTSFISPIPVDVHPLGVKENN